jgi:hypothetical protein
MASPTWNEQDFEPLSLDAFNSAFNSLWATSSKSFEKIEACPVFVEDNDESFDMFRKGDIKRAGELVRERVLEQRETYTEMRGRGARIKRYRVVGEPLTAYIRDYELVAYEAARTIGEEIVYVPESQIAPKFQGLCRDMLVFDRNHVLMHQYTPWGRLIGAYQSSSVDVVKKVTELLDHLESISNLGI